VRDSASFSYSTTIDDVLIQLVPDAVGGSGIDAWADDSVAPGSSTLTARHVTILGNGAADAIGVHTNASARWSSFPATTQVVLVGVILRGFKTDLARGAIGGSGSGTANVSIDYSDYDPAKSWDMNSTGGAGAITDGGHNLNVDPLFADPTAGDFGLQAGSPLIDRAEPPPLAPDEPTTDLAGNPRVVDGNGDGIAISDMGAFEYQPPPTPPASTPAASLTLTQLLVSPKRFAVAPSATAKAGATRQRSKHAPRGATIHFTLSRTAVVTFTVVHPGAGRRSGARCIAPSRRLRRAKRCDLTLYAFTRHGSAGLNEIPFSGRVGYRGRTPLAPGRYLLFATAATGTSHRTHFTIVQN
jgi:hypothetical protein